MKKEKKRELTIEQLEKRENITDKIAICSAITAMVGSIAIVAILTIISVVTGITFSYNYVFARYALFALLCFLICIISSKLSEAYGIKIRDKTKMYKVNTVKKMAGGENIKEKVTLKGETLQNAILSNNIDKVVFKEIKVGAIIPKDADCTIELYLKDGSCLKSFFSMKDFLKLINRATKARILNHVIKSIKIENSEVSIDADNFNYKEKVTDDELDEMFELKE